MFQKNIVEALKKNLFAEFKRVSQNKQDFFFFFFFAILVCAKHMEGKGFVEMSTLLEWNKIRDTFFGQDYVSQNIPLALEMASSCQHPDARWLTEACAGKDVTTKEDAKRVFSSLGQNDARAICFAWFCDDREDLTPLHSQSCRSGVCLGASFAGKRIRAGGEVCARAAVRCSRRARRLRASGMLRSLRMGLRKELGQGKGKLFACERTW
jgi:hypothetical protein